MKYTALWTQTAESHLADVWMNGRDCNAVVRAVEAIDRQLRQDAHSHGESREGAIRIAFESPRGIYFEPIPDDRVVYVLAVWSTARGGS